MSIYKLFLNAKCKLTDFKKCGEKDIDDLCTQLEVPIIYKLRLRNAIDEYKKETAAMEKKKEPGTYVLDKLEKTALKNINQRQSELHALLESIPKLLEGEFSILCLLSLSLSLPHTHESVLYVAWVHHVEVLLTASLLLGDIVVRAVTVHECCNCVQRGATRATTLCCAPLLCLCARETHVSVCCRLLPENVPHILETKRGRATQRKNATLTRPTPYPPTHTQHSVLSPPRPALSNVPPNIQKKGGHVSLTRPPAP